MDTDKVASQWEDDKENPPVYTPNAPMADNSAPDNIAYDASGKAQFATINVPADDTNNGDDALASSGNDPSDAAAAASASASAASSMNNNNNNNDSKNGESFKNKGGGSGVGNGVYNGNNGIGEGGNVNVNGGNNNNNERRLPPWFESTGNVSVDYKLARSRCCCCSLRAGIESLGIGIILISIWDLLISTQYAEEQVLMNILSLFRILGGLCGFYGAWKYHKNASKVFFCFWIVDLILQFCLLFYSIDLIENCSNDYDDSDDDWGWWYEDDCRYKYENFTGFYSIMCIAEIYFITVARRFYKLMAQV